MPFRFSLAEVLDYRKRIEETRQRELSEILRRIEYVEGLVREAGERRDHYRRELNEVVPRKGSAGLQQIYLDYLRGLDDLIRRTELHLEDLRKERDRRRAVLQAAMRDHKIMEELRKAELRAYLLEERRAEGRTYDEIAVRNYLMAAREKAGTS
jgi:flagellar export protein FliJ